LGECILLWWVHVASSDPQITALCQFTQLSILKYISSVYRMSPEILMYSIINGVNSIRCDMSLFLIAWIMWILKDTILNNVLIFYLHLKLKYLSILAIWEAVAISKVLLSFKRFNCFSTICVYYDINEGRLPLGILWIDPIFSNAGIFFLIPDNLNGLFFIECLFLYSLKVTISLLFNW